MMPTLLPREKGWENKRKSKEAKASVKAKADKDKSEREAHLRTTSGYKEPKRVTNKERIEDWEGYSKKQRAHLGAKRSSLLKKVWVTHWAVICPQNPKNNTP